MDTTKTGDDLEVALPDELVDGLAAHIAQLDAHPVASKSEYLFPSLRTGGMVASTALRKPFAAVMKDMGLGRKLTAKAMRRTYQDLADEAQMRAAAAMAVSGHKTPAMKLFYSTPHDDEIRAGVGKVIEIATAQRRAGSAANHEKRHEKDAGAASALRDRDANLAGAQSPRRRLTNINPSSGHT